MSVDQLLTDTASRLFAELCTHSAIQAAEENGGAPEIWAAFAETGFPWISLPEAAGGSGGTLLDALEVLRLVGYHAAPIPAAETGRKSSYTMGSARSTPRATSLSISASSSTPSASTHPGPATP